MPDETPAKITEADLLAMRQEIAEGGGSIEETRDDDGYHVVITWANGKTDTFLADV
jgi:hypothetical protein